MVLDVNLVIIACQIHVLIMVYVLKQQRVIYAHARILTRVLTVNKVRSFVVSFPINWSFIIH